MRSVVLNADAHGFGDAILTAWISEGSKAAEDVRLVHFATGARKLLLEMLAQTVVASPTGSVTIFYFVDLVWKLHEAGLAVKVLLDLSGSALGRCSRG